jgi:hypothetical protein
MRLITGFVMLGMVFILGCAGHIHHHRQSEHKGGTQVSRRLISEDGTLQVAYLLYLPEQYYASE